MQKRTLNSKFDKTHQKPRKSREVIEDFSSKKQPPQAPTPQKSKPCERKSPPPKQPDKSIYLIEKSPFEMMNTR